jgi:hypothetical protein
MIIDIFIIIFQADRKTHEKFPKEINKILPNKRKKTETHISITEKQNIRSTDILIDQT